MTTETLTKKTSNCGGFLTVAEAQSIVIMGDMGDMQEGMMLER